MAERNENGWLDAAWNQRGLNALRETLDVDPATQRDMIEFLFDTGLWDRETLSDRAAHARWHACMNPAKADFFKLSEVWALMKRFNRHALFAAMADDLGFELRRIADAGRLQSVLDRLADVQERHAIALEAATAELVRFGMPDTSLRIHPATREPGPKFSLPGPLTDDTAASYFTDAVGRF